MTRLCSHLFPRKRRLADREFAAVIRVGKPVRSRGVVILLRKNNALESRFGIIVPKRVVRRSVDRNRSKRVLREWFRQNDQKLQGHDCVVRLTACLKGKAGERALIAEIERLLVLSS